jgi:hypothetical protein
MRGSPLAAIAVLTIALLLSCVSGQFNAEATGLVVHNSAGEPIELYWLQVGTGQLVLQTTKPIQHTASVPINSYRSHAFVVTKSGSKEWNENSKFVMGELDEKVFVYKNESTGELYTVKRNKASDLREHLMQSVQECGAGNYGVVSSGDEGQMDCLAEKLGELIALPNRQLKEERTIRRNIGKRLRNYTCADPEMQSAPSIENSTWNHQGKYYAVSKLFQLGGVKIMLIDNFVTDDECSALKERATPHLTRAAVTGENGEAVVSNSRRALAAMVTPKRNENDILA